MASLACDDERRVPWPAELGWAKAHARFMFAYADTDCDDDELPDAYSPTGTITFSWDSPSFRFTPEEGEPIGLAATSVTAKVLADGTIALDGSNKTENGYIVFMPTVNPRLEPNESTILVSFSVAGASFSPVRFAPEPGKDYNLIAMVDIPASTGAVTIVSTDTALRAELAAQRAEEASAGVADISEQVTQVETYALTAQNAASQAEATLVNAVTVAGKLSEDSAAMQEHVDYLRDVIAQHGALKGDKGDPGPAPVIEWQGDRLSVDGQLSPALTGAPGQDGGPVPVGGTAGQVITRTEDGGVAWTDVAGGDGLNIVGPGRPDQPGTTGLLIDGSETVGTTYTSTDGAGVGAWVWRKRPNGWIVVDGDTGIRLLTSPDPDITRLTIQRIGKLVALEAVVTGNGEGKARFVEPLYGLPVGFQPQAAPWQRWPEPSVDLATRHSTTGRLYLERANNNKRVGARIEMPNVSSSAVLQWITDDTWPSDLPGTPLN